MYSRTFSDKPHPPPEYGGTVLSQHGDEGRDKCREAPHCKPPEEECGGPCAPCDTHEGHDGGHRPPPPHGRGLFSNLLPFDIKSDDLLLLGIALLLLNDGCEDEYLPLLLLFLLIIH